MNYRPGLTVFDTGQLGPTRPKATASTIRTGASKTTRQPKSVPTGRA